MKVYVAIGVDEDGVNAICVYDNRAAADVACDKFVNDWQEDADGWIMSGNSNMAYVEECEVESTYTLPGTPI